MAEVTHVATQPTPQSTVSRRRLFRLPLSIWFPIAVFALMRLFDAALIVVASRHQIPLTTASEPYYIHTPTPANPGYWSVVTNWDGQWYERIAREGYTVPDGSGSFESYAAGHAFAYLPLYPLLVGLVMHLTGLSFSVAASIVSVLCGAAAMIVLFKVIERATGTFAAASCVALVSAFISAPVLQIGYKESLVLLLLLLWFCWVQQRRYWWAAVAVLALCFAKYLTAPIALVMVAHSLHRWRGRSTDPIQKSEWLGMGSVVLVATTGVLAWDMILRLWLGDNAMVPYRASDALSSRNYLPGMFGQFYGLLGLAGLAIPALVVCALILVTLSPRAKSWGIEARTWLWAYPTYIVAASPLLPATLRYLLLTFPLGLIVVGSPEAGKTPRRKVWLVIGFCILSLALHWWWIDTLLIVRKAGNTFWGP